MTSGSIVLYKTDIPMVSEVIHSFFRGKSLGRKMFLVDNSPTDELSILKDLYPEQMEYIFCNANLGYGKAHNIAIRKSMEQEFKYHVVLNPDLSFDEDTITELEKFMDENEDVGQCMPDIRNMDDNSRRNCCKLLPTPANGIFRRFLGNTSLARKLDEKYLLKSADYSRVLDIPYLSGCFMFFRNSALKEIGLFDEKIFMYFEDTDISRRMFTMKRACYVPYTQVKHVAERATYKSFKMLLITIKSAIYYFNKYGWFFDKERSSINSSVLKETK